MFYLKNNYIYIYIYIFFFLYTAFPSTFPFFEGLFLTVPVSEKKRRRPYRMVFLDLETPYGTTDGVSRPYQHVRPAFRPF
jgi:hypothetical protein